jgi:SAM-dependent methyltransferase
MPYPGAIGWLRTKVRAFVDPGPADAEPPIAEPEAAPVGSGLPDARAIFAASLRRFDSRDAWLASLDGSEAQREQRYRLEQAIAAEMSHGPYWFHCTIGDHLSGLQPAPVPDPSSPFDWREQGACPACGLNARMRLCLELMRLELEGVARPSVYLTEQATRGYAAANRLFPGALGSEFVFDVERIARLQDYVQSITGDPGQRLRSEDVTRLSFDDASLDAIGSFEVLEHVPDYPAALAEFARVLKPGGLLVLTVPFLDHSGTTLVRARVADDGSIEHIEPPEYHGDPTSADGALCFHHFGWDLFEALKRLGFERIEYVTAWSLSLGLLGSLGAFVARRR